MTFALNESQQIKHEKADVMIGCDGAYSSVRRAMMKTMRFDYSQQYIEHGYIELTIPPASDGQFAMEANCLHIWPRGSFMMIALPNVDRSFTVTLFMPFTYFNSIQTEEDLLKFFTKNFIDSIPLIGIDALIRTYFEVGPQSLISIKCSPYNYNGKAVLMGDAAHAMVPFFGQGMNCGFEDCLILDELLASGHNRLSEMLPLFSESRVENCHTIVELAMYNYIEMRDLVNSKKFLLRKIFDSFLNYVFPRHWIPLYSMVTFTRIPYKKCIADRNWQDRVIDAFAKISIIGLFAVLFFQLYRNVDTFI